MEAKRILVVDDEPEIVSLFEEILGRQGYEVDSASDGAGALEKIRARIFDAAILDFNLPDMNGVMLHRQIRQIDAELGSRTLFISGMAQAESKLDYYATYGMGFLSKPIDVHTLIAAVERLVEPGPTD